MQVVQNMWLKEITVAIHEQKKSAKINAWKYNCEKLEQQYTCMWIAMQDKQQVYACIMRIESSGFWHSCECS